jgi:protein O-mannosyl-transferase
MKKDLPQPTIRPWNSWKANKYLILFFLFFGIILYGKAAVFHNAVNMMIYTILCLLLFFVMKQMLQRFNILFPFLITLLFMAHPVHTGVVTSKEGRPEMIAFICGLAALWFLLHYAEKRNMRFLVLTLLIFFTGCLITPAMLPFLLIYPLALFFFTDLSFRHCFPLIAAMVALALIARFSQRLLEPAFLSLNMSLFPSFFPEVKPSFGLKTGLMFLLFYLRILIFPNHLANYSQDAILMNYSSGILAFLSFLIYTGLLFFAFRHYKEKHFLSFAILYFMSSIFLYANIFFPALLPNAERSVFTASLGFCMILVYFIFILFQTDPRSLTIEIDARLKILATVFFILIPYIVMTIIS